MLTMLLTAMISTSATPGSGASVGVQVGGYVQGGCRVEAGSDPAAAPRCTRAMEVSVSRETVEAGELVRVRVTPRQ